MKTQISTSLKLIAVVLFSSLLFTQAKAQTGCVANWQAFPSGCYVKFTDASTGTGSNTTYSWTFGDGQTSTIQNPVHTYASSGTYSVCLTIYVPNPTNPNSPCTNTLCKTVTVQCPTTLPCTANWSFQTGGTASCIVYFTDASSGATAWSWTFGDGQTSNVKSPVHSYSVTGSYSVCLTITVPTPAGNCTNTLCKFITVYCPTGIASLSQGDLSLSVNNPIFSSADIQYSIPSNGNIELVLFDIVGNKIGVLENGSKNAGMHSYKLNTGGFSKGIYFIHLDFEGMTITKKIIIAE